jgi:hypothetical protein
MKDHSNFALPIVGSIRINITLVVIKSTLLTFFSARLKASYLYIYEMKDCITQKLVEIFLNNHFLNRQPHCSGFLSKDVVVATYL